MFLTHFRKLQEQLVAWCLDALESAHFQKVRGGGYVKSKVTWFSGILSYRMGNLLTVFLSLPAPTDAASALPYSLAPGTLRWSNPTSNCQCR